jgi:hypothetical protein
MEDASTPSPLPLQITRAATPGQSQQTPLTSESPWASMLSPPTIASRYLTASSIPPHLLHHCPCTPDPDSDHYSDTNSDSESGAKNDDADADVGDLLQGMSPSDFVWTQKQQQQQQGNAVINHCDDGTRNLNGVAVHDSAKPCAWAKVTSCELEIDIDVAAIRNSRMRRLGFGEELWEEERIRCERAGMEEDSAPTPPFTQTDHRDKYQSELNYLVRFENLRVKGLAWKRALAGSGSGSSPAITANAALPSFASQGLGDRGKCG